MPTISSLTNLFITAQEGFTTTLSSSIASGAATVPLNSVAGYTDGDTIALVIDPADPVKKQVVVGTVDSSGSQLTSCVWTEGTNQAHSAGATAVDYVTATHQAALVKGILTHANQDGTLKNDAVTTSVIADGAVTTAKIGSGEVQNDNVADGIVVQRAFTAYNSVGTTTTLIPNDDTPPQSTEGAEFMSVTITPKSATNILRVECDFWSSHTVAGAFMFGALFKDSETSARAVTATGTQTATLANAQSLAYEMVAGGTSAITFKLRCGAPNAGTFTFNGQSGARKFGGLVTSNIRVTEFKAS